MKFVIQRVKKAICRVHGVPTGAIQEGLFVLMGFKIGDDDRNFDRSIEKILNLRVFSDENGLMNLSLKDTNKELLVVSQFTLYGDAMKGNRPSFINSMPREGAHGFYNLWIEKMKSKFPALQTGQFSADMQIESIADGPITIIMEF